MTDAESQTLFSHLPKLSNIVKKATNCNGVNILMNNEAEAGQMVFHPHVHVIPRFADDNLVKHPGPKDGMITKEQAESILSKMK